MHRGLTYRPDIEGLRAVAILLVVAAHAYVPGMAGGFVGVDVFFVLSGYLITSLLQREFADTGRIDFPAFYARRLKRLAPALIALLLVTSLAALFFFPGYDQSKQASSARAAALWASNLYFPFVNHDYFGEVAEANLFLHTWSLGVEEQFYLVWPILMAAALREGKVTNAMLVVGAVSLSVCLYSTYTQPSWAFYMMPTRAWQFALGAIMVGRRVPASAGWLGLALIVGAAFAITPSMAYPGWLALIPAAGAAMVLASEGGVSRLLSRAPFQAIGRISYGWYLWHWPVLLLGDRLLFDIDPLPRRAMMVALSLLLATASYWLIERPVRRMNFRPLVPVLGGIACMVVGAALATGWRSYWTQGAPTVPHKRTAVYSKGCDHYYRDAKVIPCEFGNPKATRTAVLMGDSIAMHWFPAMERIYAAPEWRLVVFTKSACPMVDVPVYNNRLRRNFTECETWRDGVIKALAELKPDVVIAGNSDGYEFTPGEWEAGTERTFAALAKTTPSLMLLRASPAVPFDGPACLASVREDGCRAPSGDKHGQAVFSRQAAAAKRIGARTLDFNDLVCPNGMCEAKRGGTVVFIDTRHLNADFVTGLTEQIKTRL